MDRYIRSTRGVTLLEIMLVLAVAAMVIVLSVRYYQSASTSQQANTAVSELQAIAGAADSLAQAKGTFSQVTTSKLQTILPATGFNTPWGTAITVSGGASTLTITFAGTTPPGVCNLLTENLPVTGSSGKWADAGNCSVFTYTPGNP